MSTDTIDLGLINDDQSGVGVRRRRGPAFGRWRHSWPAAAAALLIIMATVSAAPPRPPRIAPLLSVPGGQQAVLTDQQLYVLASAPRAAAASSGATLTAYRLQDAAQRWQVSYPGLVSIEVVQDVPLVSGGGSGSSGTSALDPRTGSTRWQHDGYPIGAFDGHVLLGRFQASSHRLTTRSSAVAAVDLATGEQRWRRQVTGLRSNVGPEHLATIADDGMLRSYHLATGEQLASVHVPGLTNTAAVQVVDSQVLLRHSRWQDSTVVAYDAATLERQWSATLPGDTTPWACGRLICLIRDEQLHAIDRATGEPAWPSVTPEPFPRSPTISYLTGSDRLLLTSTSTRTPSWTVGATSGETGDPLAGWIRPQPRSVRTDDTGTPTAVLLHSDPDRHATWVGRLDPATARMDVLGLVPDTLTALCTATAELIACRQVGRERSVQVWQLRWR